MVARTRNASSMPALPSLKSPARRSRTPRGGKAPVRRKLFAACDSGEEADRTCSPAVDCCCPVQQEADMERQDSACSSLTDLGVELEPTGPSTPAQQHRSGQPTAPVAAALDDSLEAPLLYALQAWSQQLVQLQPLVRLGDEVLGGALAVMREFATARPDLAQTLHTSPPHLHAYLAAALWMVAKLVGVRTQIPNRSLVSQATQVNPQALTDFELDLLTSLEWDVAALLRRQGLLCH